MAISLGTEFEVLTNLPIDKRLVLTKTEMLNMNDNKMPSTYLATCSDDGKLYLYNKNNTVDAITGKFRVFEGGGGGDVIDDTTTSTSTTYSSSKIEEKISNIITHVGTVDDGTPGCIWIE